MSTNWHKRNLGELVKVQGGFAFKKPDFEDAGLPIVRMSDLKVGRLDLDSAVRISEYKLRLSSKFKLDAGDFLVGMSGSIGNYAIVRESDLPAYLNQRVGRFQLINEKLTDYNFITQIARSYEYKLHIDTLAAGAAQVNISPSQIESFQFGLPPKSEQTKIAEILSTLDLAIEQTEAIIAKQQRIKTGLMQDLLTKGIDENGNIRSEATHEFKDSALGRIPVEWDVAQLHEFAAAIDPQPDHRTPPQMDNGVPYIGISDFNENDSIDFDSARKISFTAYRKQRKAFTVELGDFIFGKIGTIGTPKRLPTDFDYALSANIILLKPKDKSTFVFWWMVSAIVENLVALEIHSTSQPAFGIQKMRSLSIPRLTNIEQHQIGKVFDKFAETMSSESTRLVKLRKLKAGLMQDLLTGKVRVSDIQNPISTPESSCPPMN